MSTESIVLVGTAWAVLLLILLVLREFLRAARSDSRARVLPVLNRLVVVMIVAFSIAAVVRLASLINPADVGAGATAVPSEIALASPSPAAVTPASPTSKPSASAQPQQTPRPTRSPGPGATGTPKPVVTPSPAPTPAPTPTPQPTATPQPSPTTAPTPSGPPEAAGQVTVPTTFNAYEVRDGRVVSFRRVRASAPETARASAPEAFSFPTFSNPHGTIRLVNMLSGPYAGTWVSPDDPGVRYTPGP